MTAEEIVRRLGLAPLPFEGGWFVETWRAGESWESPRGARALGTAIYYLITPRSFSKLHRVPGVEVFHFYCGDAVEMLQLLPGGRARTIVLGSELEAGSEPQVVVPAGAWQGTRLLPGGVWALLGTTMAPGFDPADYEPGARAGLIARWPEHRRAIEALTPP